jgi:predicted SAM-dependent methyltransferase
MKKSIKPILEPKPIRLDLACGDNKQVGFTGVDIKKTPQVDIVADLEKFPWTFAKDNSIDEIFCSHYVEHTPDLIKFMDECYRILKPGNYVEGQPQVDGPKMTVFAPYYSSVRAWQDPTHKRAISEMTFLYFNKGWRVQNKLNHYGIKSDFDFTYGYSVSPEWASKSEEARNFAIRNYINVITDIQATLFKRPLV